MSAQKLHRQMKVVRSDKKGPRGPSAAEILRDDKTPLLKRYSNRLTYDELVNAESVYGRTLFGAVPAGHRREFFEQRKNVWVWHESWTDAAGILQDITIRYEVRPTGVFKKPIGGAYERIMGNELKNFVRAAKEYYKIVTEKLYN